MKKLVIGVLCGLAIFLSLAGLCSASPVLELYESHRVKYVRDCNRGNWQGYYHTGEDLIHLRKESEYPSEEIFNQAALHELTHWTRADHRLGPVGGCHCQPDSFEEVVCDIVASMLADDLGVPRLSDKGIADYIAGQLGPGHLEKRNQEMIFEAAKESLEYLIEAPYSEAKLREAFYRLGVYTDRPRRS